jgi:hypothetical protein
MMWFGVARSKNLPLVATDPCRAMPGTPAGGKILPPGVAIRRSGAKLLPLKRMPRGTTLKNDGSAGF